MTRWRVGVGRAVAASVLGLAGTALVVIPSSSAGADTADIVVDYECRSGVAHWGSGVVNLRTKLTVPTTLKVGEPLNVSWKLNYRDATRFGAPARLPNGGRIEVTGRVNLTGAWQGVLQPTGSVEQPRAMVEGTPLKLPEGISDSGHLDRVGTVTVKPGKLFVDFRPPASEVMVNDDDPAIIYSEGWEDLNDQPSQNQDYHLDLHRTTVAGAYAEFTFTGTGIEYVAQKDQRAGPVDIFIDGQPGTPPRIDPSKNDDGTLVNDANRGGQTLWSFRGLPFGEHTIKIRNVEEGKWGQLDAFRVITRELANPPKQYRAECTLVSAPVAVQVKISDGSPNKPPTEDPPASVTPTVTDAPSTPPNGPSTPPGNGGPGNDPSPSPSPTPSPTPPVTPTTHGTVLGVQAVSTPTPTATRTVTTTVTPTVAQVWITPKGGAHTGEAPEQTSSASLLLGSGGLMLMLGVFSGVALRRRRAAHSGDLSAKI